MVVMALFAFCRAGVHPRKVAFRQIDKRGPGDNFVFTQNACFLFNEYKANHDTYKDAARAHSNSPPPLPQHTVTPSYAG